jgi:hypothetical protein
MIRFLQLAEELSVKGTGAFSFKEMKPSFEHLCQGIWSLANGFKEWVDEFWSPMEFWW